MRRTAPFGLVALLALAQPTAAQMSPGARSVAMGGGGMVFATGVDAVEWNPANLGWAGGWNVSLFELGAVGLGEGATVNEILAIFGADIGGAADLDVAQVVAGLPDEGIRLSFVTEGFATAYAAEQADIPTAGSPLPSIGLAIGSIAVRIRSRVFNDITLSKELADLIGNGYVEENIQNYAVGNTGWRTTSLSEITVSYGTTLGDILSIGVGGRYVKGNGMISGRFFEPQIDLNCVGPTPPVGCTALSVQSVAVEATDGTGYGLDVGLSLDLPGGFRASASGTNVVQQMTWNEDLVAHTAAYTDTDFDNGEDFIDLINRYDAQPLDPNAVSLAVYQAADGLFDQSYFPQVFRGGFGWQAGGTSLEATGVKVSPRGRFASPWDERLSLGFEQKIPLLTLRAGYAIAQQGITALTGGLGLGLGPVHLEASGGRFRGENVEVSTPWEGYYGTIALQIMGGGR
jgi:hypothetical protein